MKPATVRQFFQKFSDDRTCLAHLSCKATCPKCDLALPVVRACRDLFADPVAAPIFAPRNGVALDGQGISR